jgi:hypothetical protein
MIKAAEKPKAPDKFFKKSHIYVLLAHGEEDTDAPRVAVPPHTYVALTSECGNALVLDKDAEEQLFAYDKQVLIPTSTPEVARAESTLELKGVAKNVLARTESDVKFKIYTPNAVPKYDVRYNSIPSINISPLVVMVIPHKQSITYILSDLSRDKHISKENRMLKIYLSGLYSKTHIPRLPPQCNGAPKVPSIAKTPVFGDQFVALDVPQEYYVVPLVQYIHINAMFNAWFYLFTMTNDSYFSFSDICVYAYLEKYYTPENLTYELFLTQRTYVGDHIIADTNAIYAHRLRTYEQLPYGIVKSPIWNVLSLNDIINIKIPLSFILSHIRSMHTKTSDILLLTPTCRGMKSRYSSKNITNTNRATIRRRRNFSQRTPPQSKRKTARQRYKWKRPHSIPEPTSAPSSVVSNLGYGNYGDLPNDL